MMNSLSQRLSQLIRPEQARQLAREQGWQKRNGKISPFEFLHSALGQGSALHLTLSAQAGSLSEPVSRQAIDQRYTEPAVKFFQSAFQQCVLTTLTWKTDSSMAQWLAPRFAAVRIFDSTQCPCSDALAQLFPACGGGGSQAGLKVLLSYDYGAGQLHPLEVLPSKRSDQGLADRIVEELRERELGLFDKGFYRAAALRRALERGAHFLTPWPHGVSVFTVETAGQPRQEIDVAAVLHASQQNCVEWPAVQLGQTQESRLDSMRLIAYRLNDEAAGRRRAHLREKYRTKGRQPSEKALELAGWLILMTSAPAELLPVAAVGFLYRVRWQVELIFKQWKSVLRLDVLESDNPYRVQCEVWSRLFLAVLTFVWYQHANAACLQLHACEISFAKVARLLQQDGQTLVRAMFGDHGRLPSEYRFLWKKLLKLARKERQPSRPTTWENVCTHWLQARPTATLPKIHR